ncbi:regulator of chromosome condensation [Anaeramoeba flamelloides]|uniref:Regulator of chromosome condensation n=1 Tax=Anaeramoeba flamelloides TaxID=1746091 RepID=A0AAV7YER6_9EUKA|nr:regulator of chromosome condensation [Anaeramoeba flamelloides]
MTNVLAFGKNGGGLLGTRPEIYEADKPISCELFKPLKVTTICKSVNATTIVDSKGTLYQLNSGSDQLIRFSTEPIQSLVCGTYHFVALSRGYKVYTWATEESVGSYGQLGNGLTVSHSSPKMINPMFFGNKDIIDIGCSLYCTFVLALDGTLFSFGKNQYADLGVGDRKDRNVPTKVSHSVSRIFIGFSHHAFFLGNKGRVFGWGRNGWGQLGLNEKTDCKERPTEVEFFGDKELKEITVTYNSTVALTKDGSLYSTGGYYNNGHKKTICSFEKLTFFDDKPILQYDSGRNFTIVVTNDLQIYIFGQKGDFNVYGQTEVIIKAPFDLSTTSENFNLVCGRDFSCFIIQDDSSRGKWKRIGSFQELYPIIRQSARKGSLKELESFQNQLNLIDQNDEENKIINNESTQVSKNRIQISIKEEIEKEIEEKKEKKKRRNRMKINFGSSIIKKRKDEFVLPKLFGVSDQKTLVKSMFIENDEIKFLKLSKNGFDIATLTTLSKRIGDIPNEIRLAPQRVFKCYAIGIFLYIVLVSPFNLCRIELLSEEFDLEFYQKKSNLIREEQEITNVLFRNSCNDFVILTRSGEHYSIEIEKKTIRKIQLGHSIKTIPGLATINSSDEIIIKNQNGIFLFGKYEIPEHLNVYGNSSPVFSKEREDSVFFYIKDKICLIQHPKEFWILDCLNNKWKLFPAYRLEHSESVVSIGNSLFLMNSNTKIFEIPIPDFEK